MIMEEKAPYNYIDLSIMEFNVILKELEKTPDYPILTNKIKSHLDKMIQGSKQDDTARAFLNEARELMKKYGL